MIKISFILALQTTTICSYWPQYPNQIYQVILKSRFDARIVEKILPI